MLQLLILSVLWSRLWEVNNQVPQWPTCLVDCSHEIFSLWEDLNFSSFSSLCLCVGVGMSIEITLICYYSLIRQRLLLLAASLTIISVYPYSYFSLLVLSVILLRKPRQFAFSCQLDVPLPDLIPRIAVAIIQIFQTLSLDTIFIVASRELFERWICIVLNKRAIKVFIVLFPGIPVGWCYDFSVVDNDLDQ